MRSFSYESAMAARTLASAHKCHLRRQPKALGRGRAGRCAAVREMRARALCARARVCVCDGRARVCV